MDLDYEKLLERAREGLEDVMSNNERFSPPTPDVLHEGSKKTIIRNFTEMVDVLRRDENHLYKFLLQELGTAGSINNRRLVLQGRVPEKKIKDNLEAEIFNVCFEEAKEKGHKILIDDTTKGITKGVLSLIA